MFPLGKMCYSQTTEKSVKVQILKPVKNIQMDSVIDKIMESERNCYYYNDSSYLEMTVYPITDGVGFRIDPIDDLHEIFEKNDNVDGGCFIHDGHCCFVHGEDISTLFIRTDETMLFSYKVPVDTAIIIIDDSRSMRFYEYKNGELGMVDYCPCEDNREIKERIDNPFELKPIRQVQPKFISSMSSSQHVLPIYKVDDDSFLKVLDTVIASEKHRDYFSKSLIFYVDISKSSFWSKKMNEEVFYVSVWTSGNDEDINDVKGCFYYKGYLFYVINDDRFLLKTLSVKQIERKTYNDNAGRHDDVISINTRMRYDYLYFDRKFVYKYNMKAYDLKLESDSEERITVYVVPEQNPSFPGGMEAIHDYIYKNLVYPQNTICNHIKGTCLVSFVVMSDGSIRNVFCCKGFDVACDEEAVRLVKSMPKWNPGKQGGIPVNVDMAIPITFELRGK